MTPTMISCVDPDATLAKFFNCQTTLVFEFRDIFPGVFGYDGNRALLLPAKEAVDEVALRKCFSWRLPIIASAVHYVRGYED